MAKICLITDSLSEGGAERMVAKMSRALHSVGYEVFIISLRDNIDYNFSGQLVNLGKGSSKIKLVKQFQKILAFKKAYISINADIYIDFRIRSRTLMEFILHQYIFDLSRTIFSIRSYHIFLHMPKHNYFFKIYSKCKAIVCPSRDILIQMKLYYDFKNLKYIPNFLHIQDVSHEDDLTPIADKFIVSVGRLNNEVKQFDKLIYAYKQSDLIKKDIKLLIFGDGKDRSKLEKLIRDENLNGYISIQGFTNSIQAEYSKALFTVLCSKFEGFPNVLLESLSASTPVVSFNCKSGPSDLIQDGFNGALVEDQNFLELTQAMNKMVNDETYYNVCKANALASVQKFSKEIVIKQWQKILPSLL